MSGLWLLLACETCYGADRGSGPMIDGAKIGVALLLIVTIVVQAAFLAFFLHLRQKARQAHDAAIDTEWSQMQHELASGRRTLEHP